MPIERTPDATRLTLTGPDVDRASLIQALRSGAIPEHVCIFDSPLTESDLAPLSVAQRTLRLLRLETLNGDYPPFRFTDGAAQLFVPFTQLRVLMLLGCEVDFSPARHVPASVAGGLLTALYLDESTITEQTFAQLMSSWGNFTTLSLRGVELTAAMAAAVSQQTELKCLFLSGARLPVDSFQFLKPLQRLAEIRLCDVAIAEPAFRELAEFLPGASIYRQDRF